MATNTILGKWDHVKEEEEALLLLINNKEQHKLRKEDSSSSSSSYLNEEFDFLFFKEQEMCAADDVFFQGQILPLCPSIKHNDHKGIHQLNHSESISSNKSLEFQSNSNSSRSSSVRSQNSSTSTCSTTSTTIPTTIITTPTTSFSKPRIQNQFHTLPSPKPQLRKFGQRQTSGRKSSLAWEFFRIGVVPMHEIGLRDLKVNSTITTINPFFSNPNKNHSNPNGRNPNKSRGSNRDMNCRNPDKSRVSNLNMNCRNPNKNCVSNSNKSHVSNRDMNYRNPDRNRVSNPNMNYENPNKNRVSRNNISGSIRNSTRKNVKMGNKAYHHNHDNGHVLKQFVYKGSGLFMSGCKCSIETVPLENVMIKCGTKSGNKTESTQHAKKEKVVDLKKLKNRGKK